jgi:hypothetical protein
MIIHDTRQGVSAFEGWTNTEVYGNLIYFNGWTAPDRGHGHGVYTQNQGPGFKKFFNNILFQGFAFNIQAYGDAAYLDNFDMEGNTLFLPGGLLSTPGEDLLLGGIQHVAQNPIVTNNYLYMTASSSADFQLGYAFGVGTNNGIVLNNQINVSTFVAPTNLTMTGNTFLQAPTGITESSYPGNTYLNGAPPTGTLVFIQPNLYEPGRANITIYNWGLASSVSVDLSAILSAGSTYQIQNAQDFFAAPVLSGTYDGNPVSIPMTGLSVATPVGWPPPPPAGPSFNAFVLMTRAPARRQPISRGGRQPTILRPQAQGREAATRRPLPLPSP